MELNVDKIAIVSIVTIFVLTVIMLMMAIWTRMKAVKFLNKVEDDYEEARRKFRGESSESSSA